MAGLVNPCRYGLSVHVRRGLLGRVALRRTFLKGADIEILKQVVARRTQSRVARGARGVGQLSPVEDVPLDTELVDHKPAKLRAALQTGNLSFGFSAGGLLFPYYIGVLYTLCELGIVTDQTKLAGASAGSLITACFHAGMSKELVTRNCLELAHDCRKGGTRGRLRHVLKRFLDASLPDDAHERCTDLAYVAVTKAPRTSLLLSEYKDKEDLVSALLTSCHIPVWFDYSLFTTFRGELHYDGGITNFIPVPPHTEAVRVCCFPASQLSTFGDLAICPDAFKPWPYQLREMLGWAFEPADEDMLCFLIQQGEEDAASWAEHMGLLDVVINMSSSDVTLDEDAAVMGQRR